MQRFQEMPGFVRGAAWGPLVWSAAATGSSYLNGAERYMPHWVKQLDLIDSIGSLCTLIAYPVSAASFLWIWGGDGPRWAYSVPLNIVAGILWSLAAGVITGFVFERSHGAQLCALVLCFVVSLPLLLLLTLDG